MTSDGREYFQSSADICYFPLERNFIQVLHQNSIQIGKYTHHNQIKANVTSMCVPNSTKIESPHNFSIK